MKSKRKYLGFVVSHTHWDRAWYLPFQNYRLRLVRMIDNLLDLLEGDPRYQSFMLDGQTVILEDYLALRPQNKERISALVKTGRLAIGPWYTLPDLFIPCGESIVRNLQMGCALSKSFGEPMDAGYVPDPFGHFAQLPQILQGFEISSFLFMRGADKCIEETGSIFHWKAPDGSTVLAVYMREGYLPCGALGHPAVFGRFDGHTPVIADARKRILDTLSLLCPLQKEKALLLLNGCDHMPPQAELPDILKALNDQESDIELISGTIADFLKAVRQEGLEHKDFEGDLIGNYHHPILLSVYSTRMYLKQKNRYAENFLLRIVEPLRALFSQILPLPESDSFLLEAWKLLLKNQAHDDICGCSVDAVHREDEVRFEEVIEIASALSTETLECIIKEGILPPALTDSLHSNVFLFNPHPFSVKSRIRVSVLLPNPGGEWAAPTEEKQLCAVSGMGHRLPLTVEFSEPRAVRSAFLETSWGRRYHIALDVEMEGMSYDLVHIFEMAEKPLSCLKADRIFLENARFSLHAGQNDFYIFDKLLQKKWNEPFCLEYEEDRGDTYSFSPVSGSVPLCAKLLEIKWHPQKSNTILAIYLLSFSETTSINIEVSLSLLECEAISYEIFYENKISHGRLRALFPLGFEARSLKVDGHFRIAERSVPDFREPVSRPYPGEIPYDTFHQGEFAWAEQNGLRVWLANRGNPEISLVQRKDSSYFAITLHRAVNKLSVYGGSIRQCQAGPEVPTPDAICLRSFSHHLAWGVGLISPGEVYRRSLSFAVPLWAQEMPYLPYVKKEGKIPRYQSFLRIDNPNIALDSCRTSSNKGIVLRLHNLSSEIQQALLSLGFEAKEYCTTNLYENWNKNTEQKIEKKSISIFFRPSEIVTIVVR